MDSNTTTFEKLKSGVIEQVKSHFPYAGAKRTLVLKSITAQDDLRDDDLSSQTKAKDLDGTWGVAIKGELELVDNQTGQRIGRPQVVTLARLPKMTSRYSFIVKGSEYQVDHLLRLKSGVYNRMDRRGVFKSEFNLRKGPNFDIFLDPDTKRFNWVLKGGSAKIPVYPLMKSLGVADEAMEHAWGPEIFAANKVEDPKNFQAVLANFWKRTKPLDHKGPAPVSTDDLAKHVFNHFEGTEIYPDTTKLTLGQSFNKVTGQAMLTALSKLLAVRRGEAKQDDRDSLVFKEVVHVEDFIPEKLARSWKKIHHKIRFAINHKDNISHILQGGAVFSDPIEEFFTQGGNVSERGEQTNPLTMLGGNFKTTIVAPDYGGIKSPRRLSDEMRAINPSHFAFLDPMHTPESERTGVTLHLGSGVRKSGKTLETPVYDLKSGKFIQSQVGDFHHATVVLPDQVKWEKGKPVPVAPEVKVKLPGGDIGMRPFKEAQYVMPSAKSMFSYASNLIPFLPTDQGNRTSMADKQMEQAISLVHREAPLVQSAIDVKKGHTYEKLVGSFATTLAPAAGKVVAVKPDAIHIQDGRTVHQVSLYQHFPTNDPKGMLHSEPLVKVGDKVEKGQVLADTNYTKQGQLALGTNLRVGYLPYHGYNFEDGIVISESAAKKLTSQHLHKMFLELDPHTDVTNPKEWRAASSRKARDMSSEHFAMLDADGVIKPGSKVKPGQVLATALAPNLEKQDEYREFFGSRGVKAFRDKSLVWDEDHEGVVEKVVKAPNGKSVKVFVRTEERAVVGDKLTGRHGNKGIITRILPDHQMPFTKGADGEPNHLEVLLNPSGIPTRMNVGQVLETAAAKIAQKTGKTYIVDNFSGPKTDYRQQVEDELKQHGLSDEEHVYDPADVRRPLGSILVGPQYLLKLKHQVEKKLAVRGAHTDLDMKPYGYDNEHQPTHGGPRGGQGFGSLEIYSLLSHGAKHNLREMATFKGDAQGEDFWNLIQEGHEPPPPTVPFSYQKFEALVRGLGVDVRKQGTALRLVPMTDKEILRAADDGKNEILKPKLLMSKNLRPEKGGLFDIQITGGPDGKKWSYIRLAEPLPNPIFVGKKQAKGPIPTLLDLHVADVDAVMAGKKQINGLSGGKAIVEALKKIDVEKELTSSLADIKTKRGNALDRANRKVKFLRALRELKLTPAEAYVLNYVPVIPPVFRPITQTARGNLVKSSLNEIYRTVAALNEKMTTTTPEVIGRDAHNELRGELWNSVKALQSVGTYKPVVGEEYTKRKLKGIVELISHAEDEQNKEGYFQSRLIKRRQDLSLRSTIVPEPSLGLDEVGLPGHAAMELYKPFIVAHMQSHYGFQPGDALSEMKKGPFESKIARQALDEVMRDRPLILKRDPTLHKFGVMAFRPKVVEGKAIKIHPLVTGGFNADFDGDTMAGTVPVSKEAVEEALRMLPSRNLFSPTSGRAMYTPNQEAMLGLHLISRWGKDSGKTVPDVTTLHKLVDGGHLDHNDVVTVQQVSSKPTTFGRILIDSKLPRGFALREKILHDPGYVIDGSTMGQLIENLAKKHEGEFDRSVNLLKDLGNEHSFKSGFSVGLKDFKPLPQRNEILAKADAEAAHVRRNISDPHKREEQIIDIYTKATAALEAAAKEHLPKQGNRLGIMVISKARGKPEQLRQMIAAPMLMQDATGRTIPTPVKRSYAEGLDVGDYWLTQHGARKGTLQRTLSTSDPGSLTKDIINSTISTMVMSEDCGTAHGISMSLNHKDINDRFLAQAYGPYKAGELITPAVSDKLRQLLGAKADVQVRSPLKCAHGTGICAKCYGLNETGHLPKVGTNIGVLAGQAMGEPATQLAMDAFHTGGLASGHGGASGSRIQRLKDLLKMPEIVRGEATLARVSGRVTDIKKNPVGGHDVFVDGHQHRVDEIDPALAVGHEVKKGASLSASHAPVNPHHLLAITKDMPRVQNYLTKKLYEDLYEKEGVRQRNIETVVRSLTNLTRIRDPGHSGFDVGDVAPHSVVEEYNRSTKGTLLKPAVHEPILEGAERIPLSSSDWIARLNYRQLGHTLIQGAAQAWKSELHGTHPIPGLVRGSEFGIQPKGKRGPSY